MSFSSHQSGGQASQRHVIVRAPRANDAIGLALSSAYDPEPSLPDDMAALLAGLCEYRPQR